MVFALHFDFEYFQMVTWSFAVKTPLKQEKQRAGFPTTGPRCLLKKSTSVCF